MIKCSICGCECKDRRVFKAHTKKHYVSDIERERLVVDSLYGADLVDKTVQEYKDAKWAFYDMPIDIRLYLTLLGAKRTSKEERQTQRYKDKYLKSIKKKYGEGITNISQAKEVQAKKEATAASKHGSYDTYIKMFRDSGEAARAQFQKDVERKRAAWSKAKIKLMNRFGVDNPAQIDYVRKLISEKARARLRELSAQELRELTSAGRAEMRKHIKGNKLEHMVWGALVALNIKFEHNVQLGQHFSADVLLPDKNIVIDIHGDFWHASPLKYRSGDYIFKNEVLVDDVWAKDARKCARVKAAGYRYVVIWEHELNQHTCDIIEFIKQRISLCA